MPVNPEVTDKPDLLYEAINGAAEAAESWAKIARDPFKAPEQVIDMILPLQVKLWNAQVEYAAMRRNSSRV